MDTEASAEAPHGAHVGRWTRTHAAKPSEEARSDPTQRRIIQAKSRTRDPSPVSKDAMSCCPLTSGSNRDCDLDRTSNDEAPALSPTDSAFQAVTLDQKAARNSSLRTT
jgi:hypothetical protein